MRPLLNPIRGLTAATITIPDMLYLVLVGTESAVRIQILTEHDSIVSVLLNCKTIHATGKRAANASDFFGQFSSVL